MSDNGSSGMTAIVAIIAIVVLIGIGYFVLQYFPMNEEPAIEVDLPGGDGQ